MSSTEQGYDLLASKFDATPFRTPDPVFSPLPELLGPVDAALDLCCGTGAAMRHLRPLCRTRLVGVDFSRGMLAEAERTLATESSGARIELVHADALDLPFVEEFDVVHSSGAFGHIVGADEDRFLAGIVRALRPGGRFVFPTGRRPSPASPALWAAHVFNAAMRLRNALRDPPFVMYYLTFLWPEIRERLIAHGLEPHAYEGRCPAPFDRVVWVVATKRG